MKLIDYLGLSEKWPPLVHPSRPRALLNHCEDIITGAKLEGCNNSGQHQVTISTTFEGSPYIRALLVEDERFAGALCKFLNKCKGQTIKAVSETDLTETDLVM